MLWQGQESAFKEGLSAAAAHTPLLAAQETSVAQPVANDWTQHDPSWCTRQSGWGCGSKQSIWLGRAHQASTCRIAGRGWVAWQSPFILYFLGTSWPRLVHEAIKGLCVSTACAQRCFGSGSACEQQPGPPVASAPRNQQ